MCGVWCVVCGVNLPFWLKFKWRMAHSRNRGTWNREPPSPLSIRGLVVYSISPIHLFFNSIPSLPPPLRATSPQYHTFHSPIHPHFHLCNLPASSTSPQHPTFHSPIHRSIHTCTSAISLPPPLRLITLPSTLPSIHTCTSAISLPRPLRLNTLHYILHPSAPSPRAPPRPPSTPPTAPPSPRRRSRGARRAPRRRSLRRHC